MVEPKLGDKFSYMSISKTEEEKSISISKYIPISKTFFIVNELLSKYNIFATLKNNKDARIQYIGTNLGFLEAIKYNNYKLTNIDCLIPLKANYYKVILDEWQKYIDNITKIYNINIQKYSGSIYDLINTKDINNNANYDIIYYDVYSVVKGIGLFESFYNTPNIYVGMLYGLHRLNINGTLIFYMGSVAYKHFADIYLILSKYFEKSDLFYAEISNNYMKTGTFGIFQNFKGCDKNTINKLNNILEDVKKIYPNDGYDFNITDSKIREKYLITKPIEHNNISYNIINGFLDDNKNNSNNEIYSYIKTFNNERYLKQLIFCTKLLTYINLDKSIVDTIKLPTNEQMINAILYCQKWDIPYWDKYSSKPFQDKFGKSILEETFGLHEPIIYRFKTPPQLHIAQSITLRLPSGRRMTSKASSSLKLVSNKTHKAKSISHSHRKYLSISDFLKPSRPLYDLSFRHSTKHNNIKNKSRTISYNRQVPLLPELEYLANRIEQTGYLIDSRRDLSKPIKTEKDKTDPQIKKWWEVNKQFRYYKHKDDTEKMHLDQLIRRRLKDDTISQAWLKMYEIITDCDLVPRNQKGRFHSFHIAEAPGTFINALNNYIHTKTQFAGFDWNAQSLHTKGTRIGDQFGLIRRHPQRWDWGATNDGDITKIRNIKYYKQRVASREKIDLMTSDAGLAMKDSGYEKVAFASLLAILDILPAGASMVYKILTPIDEPLILNLIYVAYCNFKQLIFYKPVQNNQSREFYIVGKGYLGTDARILEAFYNELKQYKEGSNRDLFHDKYPEAFVRQFVAISRQLADNYCYTIERNIYYLDNYEHITPEFARMARDYYDEKNHDWIDKYQPRRIENEVDKL